MLCKAETEDDSRSELSRNGTSAAQSLIRDDLEMGNIYISDKNKMQILTNINSNNLLEISDQFALYPDQTVSLEEFV